MREIELKFKIKDKDELLNRLDSLDCKIGELIEQKDTIYVNDLNNIESLEGSVWLRVRKEQDNIELNYKKQSSKKQESKEIEFGLDSYEKAKHFLEELGYKKWVEVNKKRRYSKYLKYNLCIDEVEGLGFFIEIELLVDEKDKNDYIDELMSVAKVLELDKQDIINSHYDTMIYELDLRE